MAGLQYKFFPTDYLFHLQPSTTTGGGGDNAIGQVSLVKTSDHSPTDDDSKQRKQSLFMAGKTVIKAISTACHSSSSVRGNFSNHSQAKLI